MNNKADYRGAERKADGLLKEFGFTNPPIPPHEIASKLGISIFEVKMPDRYKSIAGFIDFDKDQIFVNSAEPKNRQTFTIAHEIGHYVMHRQHFIDNPTEYKFLYRNASINGQDKYEKEANCFAANLLVPYSMFKKYEIYPPGVLSTLFQVSQDVINYRQKDFKKWLMNK